MIWQDWVLAAGNLVLLGALIQALCKPPPSRLMRWVYAGVLWTFAFTFGSLGLGISAFLVALQAFIWTLWAADYA